MNITSTHRPSRLTWFLLLGLLLLGSVGLLAQQKIGSPTLPSSSCLTPLVAGDASTSADEARALLPRIPLAVVTSTQRLPPGVAPAFEGPFPGEQPPDPDGFKVLYGYTGPFYNTSNLNGQVVVLSQTLYTWPTPTWEMTGILRNQTRCPIALNTLSAQLLGSNGEVIGTATATLPVANLRPGEPGPFTIQAPIAAEAVKSVEWHADFSPTQAPLRQFTFKIWNSSEAPDGSSYTLDASIENDASSTANGTSVVLAWLDENGRVLYVGSAKMNPYTQPVGASDVPGQMTAGFLYSTTDPTIASVLGSAWDTALWGISR